MGHRILALTILSGLLFASCSPSSLVSQAGLIGGLTGAAAGAGIGSAVSYEALSSAETALIGGVAGAGSGLLIGAIYHEMSEASEAQNVMVVRQAKMIDESQLEIDRVRQQMEDSANWGRLETKPWNERYVGEDSNYPYQGPAPR